MLLFFVVFCVCLCFVFYCCLCVLLFSLCFCVVWAFSRNKHTHTQHVKLKHITTNQNTKGPRYFVADSVYYCLCGLRLILLLQCSMYRLCSFIYVVLVFVFVCLMFVFVRCSCVCCCVWVLKFVLQPQTQHHNTTTLTKQAKPNNAGMLLLLVLFVSCSRDCYFPLLFSTCFLYMLGLR